MHPYIDGFVFPIPKDRLDDYQAVASAVANIYREHGAIDYLEFVGDDMQREGTRPFPDIVQASENEVIVFGWIVFDSRESRDHVNQLVEADPRMETLVAPLLDPSDPIFDPARMAYGGFVRLVDVNQDRETR
ncbi:MAG: DUF1428 domain-containing protein [Planctomycetota bacterium]